MDLSIFDVVGPVMIGPSSSHTAGAARLAFVARQIAGEFTRVSFGLHGSFARTYRGHGTDRALVAGALGLSPQDERLRTSFDIAKERGLQYDFYLTELPDAHENSVKMTFTHPDGSTLDVVGASLGGGRILITRIGEYAAEITADAPTLVIAHQDKRGMVSTVTHILASNGLNIGVMRLSRTARGGAACCVIEIDGGLSREVVREISRVPDVISVRAIDATDAAEGGAERV